MKQQTCPEGRRKGKSGHFESLLGIRKSKRNKLRKKKIVEVCKSNRKYNGIDDLVYLETCD